MKANRWKAILAVAMIMATGVILAAGWCKVCYSENHCTEPAYEQVGYEWRGSYDHDDPQACTSYNHERWRQTSSSPAGGDCVKDDHDYMLGFTCTGNDDCF